MANKSIIIEKLGLGIIISIITCFIGIYGGVFLSNLMKDLQSRSRWIIIIILGIALIVIIALVFYFLRQIFAHDLEEKNKNLIKVLQEKQIKLEKNIITKKRYEYMHRRFGDLISSIIEALAELMLVAQKNKELKWYTTREAREIEAGANEVIIFASDLTPEKGTFRKYPIEYNFKRNVPYTYYFIETQKGKFYTLWDHAKKIQNVKDFNLLRGWKFEIDLTSFQLVTLKIENKIRTFFHFPILTSSGEKDTIEIDINEIRNKTICTEILENLRVLEKSLIKVELLNNYIEK